MDEVQILKRQIDALKQLLDIKDQIIKDLQDRPVPQVLPFVCDHVYPSPWYGTIPPCCTKCGHQLPHVGWTTFSGSTG